MLLGRCTFPPPGSPIACAVSGGADSLALLVLAVSAGCDVTAHHVDHQLRAGSHLDGEVVARVAAALSVPVVAHLVDVAPGANLEARARAARRSVLPEGIATGHTMDDQAETVVLNVLRGAATDGLAGMRAGPAHPLLALRRRETRELCAELGIRPVVDETNDDVAFLRNRVRHELLPLLDEMAGRDLVPVLARQAALLADDADLLEALSEPLDPADARAVAAAPPPLARRALRRWLRDGHPPDAATTDRVLKVAAGEARATDVGGGRRVRRSKGRLALEPSARVAGTHGGGGPDGGGGPPRGGARRGGSPRGAAAADGTPGTVVPPG